MPSKQKIKKFVDSQKSIQFYDKIKKAFIEVLSNFSDDEFSICTENLILMVLHEGALGQVMHFPASKNKFKIVQLTISSKMPMKMMRYVIAHELGHVMQGRNWRKSDGEKLETDANEWAKKWGFPLDESILKWMYTDRHIKRKYRIK